MGVYYTAVFGVGINQDDIKFEDLTENTKNTLIDWFKDSEDYDHLISVYCDDDVDVDSIPDNVYQQALEAYFYEVMVSDDFLYEMGLTAYTGNLYQGWCGWCGVRVSLSDISKVQEEVSKATEVFKSVLNLEPQVFHDVLVS